MSNQTDLELIIALADERIARALDFLVASADTDLPIFPIDCEVVAVALRDPKPKPKPEPEVATSAGGVFDYPIVYEDRDEIHTSRWVIQGVSTKAGGNTARGWLWMNAARVGNTVGRGQTELERLLKATALREAASDLGCLTCDELSLSWVINYLHIRAKQAEGETT